MAPRAKNGRFIKKGEEERRIKCSKIILDMNDRVRKRKSRQAQKELNDKQKARLALDGQDIIERGTLGEKMWCKDCDVALSFRHEEKVSYCGLAAILHIRCYKCNKLYKIATSKKVLSGDGKTLFAVNCKAAASKYKHFSTIF